MPKSAILPKTLSIKKSKVKNKKIGRLKATSVAFFSFKSINEKSKPYFLK